MKIGWKTGMAALLMFVLTIPASAFAQGEWALEQQKSITALSLSQDGSKLAVGSYDANAYLYDRTGKQLARLPANNVVTDVSVIGSDRVLVASDDRHLYAYDLNGSPLWDADLKKRVEGVAASRDGSLVAVTVQNTPDLLLIDAATGAVKGSTDIGFRAADAAVSPNGQYIAVGGKDQYAYLMDGQGKLLHRTSITGSFSSVAVTDGGDLIAGLKTPRLYVIDKQGAIARTIDVDDAVDDVDVTPDGKTIGVADYGGGFYLISREGKVLWKIKVGAPATQIAFGPASGTVYGGTDNGRIYAYAVDSVIAGAEKGARQAAIFKSAAAAALLLLIIAAFLLLKRYNRLTLLKRMWKAKWIYLSLAPAFVLLIGFLYVPAFSGLYHSLYDWHPGGRSTYVGLDNFRKMLHDPYVTKGLWNLVLLIVTGLIKAIVPPLIVAELIYHLKSKKLQYYFRTAFVSSMVLPGVAMLLIWQNLYDPNMGLINHFLSLIGLGGWTQSWLGNPDLALWSLIFIGFPFVGILQLLVLYAGLLGISDELIEAAKIDGAKFLRIVRSIHLPLLSGQFKFLIILTLIGIIQDFNGILIVTGGGPMDSTYVPALQMYYAATKFDQLGYASALGVAMFAVILIITVINMKFLRSSQE